MRLRWDNHLILESRFEYRREFNDDQFLGCDFEQQCR